MKAVLTIIILGLIGVLGYLAFARDGVAPAPIVSDDRLTYSSSTLKISFKYPKDYFIVENDNSTPQRMRKSIVLVEDTATNRQLMSGQIVGEAPPGISIDIFQNVGKDDAEAWIKSNNASNWKLGPQVFATSTSKVDNRETFRYSWSGLYEGESAVAASQDFIYMFSTTWLTPQDRTINEFDKLLETVNIE